jgi:hypothetical protein
MNASIFTIGVVRVVAGVIGGRFKLAGSDFPVIPHRWQRWTLVVFGLVVCAVAYVTREQSFPPASPLTSNPTSAHGEAKVDCRVAGRVFNSDNGSGDFSRKGVHPTGNWRCRLAAPRGQRP